MHTIAKQACGMAILSFKVTSLIASMTALIALAFVIGVWAAIETLTLIV